MNLFRTLCMSAALVVSAASLNSCLSPPEFSKVPEITFKEIRKEVIDLNNGETPAINLYFVLEFKDGDGDLGLKDEDMLDPPFFPDTPGNPNRHNYFIQPFRKDPATGQFVSFDGGIDYNSRFNFGSRIPHLEKPAPLQGELVHKLPFSPNGITVLPGDEFRFEIFIKDRALNESNRITTSSVILTY